MSTLALFLRTAHEVPDEAGTDLRSVPILLAHMEDLAARELASKIGGEHDRQRREMKTEPGEQAKGNHKGDWNMDREKPGKRKLPDVRAPVTEGNVE